MLTFSGIMPIPNFSKCSQQFELNYSDRQTVGFKELMVNLMCVHFVYIVQKIHIKEKEKSA